MNNQPKQPGETLILRGFLHKLGNASPDSYEWLDGEAWYLGHPIQARATEIEQLAINTTRDALDAARILRSTLSKQSTKHH